MTEIIRVLRQEHANIARLIKALDRQIRMFEHDDTPDYDIIEGIVDYFLSYPDLYHHPKEDMIFSRLQERDAGAAALVGDLRQEHEDLALRSREFATGLQAVIDEAVLSPKALVGWAQAFIDLQRSHMEMEERLLFPAALASFTDEDWRELEARMTDDEDPLFGHDVGARYTTLRDNILRWEREGRQR